MAWDSARRDAPSYKMQTHRLSVSYGGRECLCNVSLGFEVCSITAVVGPSGCGKSTLLRSLNRMNDLVEGARTKGEVLLDGVNVYSPTVDVLELRRRVGMVFQRPNCFPASVWDNVTYGPRALGLQEGRSLRDIARDCLEAVGLWPALGRDLRRPALDLPLGQQQLLCLARALAVGPEVLLLDEPCSALDPASTLQIEELLRGLKRRYTIVLVTHNMQQAARASDFTAFLLDGRLVEYGPTPLVFTAPKDPRTEAYLRGDLVGFELRTSLPPEGGGMGGD
ncbi:MAG: phosphate ABC transporter ATP-binding protein [Acetobacteraceae bacterium]|nr:phosphate ABC transporter ATP-binding protein [Acetobacteraceae bacterium]